MARTESTMLELGTLAPDFSLPDSNGNVFQLQQQANLPVLVMFICNHCPFVKHIESALKEMHRTFSIHFAIVAINSNDYKNYPDDSPEKMKGIYPFPYLMDESQSIAKLYKAACTPDFFLFDKKHLLVYRGQFDDSRPGNQIPVTGKYLKKAMECLVRNEPISPDQKPSLGCNIKWKNGNEPQYFKG